MVIISEILLAIQSEKYIKIEEYIFPPPDYTEQLA